ncbi:MAG: RNA polymerase sigma-70 factor [Nitriliruptorales bacterium]|nr:RNA polymerase sigma-70 factor [Nitriliruptorales bacterium]
MTISPDRTSETDETLRPLLFSIAYRMVGSVTDAEDLVQEALLRVHSAEQEGVVIESRRPYACAVVSRLSIDHLRSARIRREEYVGEWLPEPIVTDRTLDPAEHAELSDSLSMAFLVLLESLSPPERAVLLLRDVFGFGFDEIAELIGKSEDNTRQVAVRARQRVQDRKPRFEASVERRWALAERFFAAVEQGDTDGLISLLAADATMYGDGGGRAPARRTPVRGAVAVARFLVHLARQTRRDGVTLALVDVNGQPGAIAHSPAGETVAVLSLDIADGQVIALRSVVNPDKLTHLRRRSSTARRRGG